MRFVSLGIVVFLFTACVSKKNTALLTQINKSNCNQENTNHYTKNDIPKPIYELAVDTQLSRYFTPKDINVAHAIGALNLLSEYLNTLNAVKQNKTVQGQLDVIQLRQKINNRIDLTSLEISAVTAELDCEEERINQIASFLKEKEMQAETKLTVGSIILGSLSAIATAVLVGTHDEGVTGDVIGISVGVADALIGVLILTNHRKIELKHSRNVLREIWLATETSSVYPPSIWYYLNYANPNHAGEISLREQLINNWKSFGQVNASKSTTDNRKLEIYFSDGGKYTTDQLENRANMYDQIESTIKLMKQDLRNLTLNIDKLEL